METITSPTPLNQRIVLLDVLRGLALFGILIVNMQVFYQPVTMLIVGYTGAASTGDLLSVLFIKFFFEGKFYVLFSFLFGYGFWLFISKPAAEGHSTVPLFLRRVLILLCIGVLHIVLLWAGDILVFYALFGFILLLFRRVSDRWIMRWAVAFASIPVVLTGLMVGLVTIAMSLPEARDVVRESLDESISMIMEFVNHAATVYREGTFSDLVSIRIAEYLQLLPGVLFFYPTVMALFLLGVWTARKELLKNYSAHIPFFRKAMWWGLAVGIPSNICYSIAYMNTQPAMPDIWMFLVTVAHISGGIALGIFYVSSIILLINRGRLVGFSRYIAPVGRMALTNYLLQSIICTTLFLPYGFGLFGRIDALQGIGISIAIFSLQIPFSNFWLRYFNYGPAEWLWRSLTYLRLQPLIRRVDLQ
jgi:uncharacterized protein